jgi:dTDP-glucose pyrophosphorylase/CBS domain-containing protein
MRDLTSLFVRLHTSIRDTMAQIDANRQGIALIVDGQQRLLNTITDGDIRRAILGGVGLDERVETVVRDKKHPLYEKPVSAMLGTKNDELLRRMRAHNIRQLPLLNEEGVVGDLVTLSDLVSEVDLPLRAVVMAGGFGTRLRPLTEDLPKPMLPVGDKPLMEHIIGGLRDAGIGHVNVTTHFKADKIREHFGDGSQFGVNIEYTAEDEPLGTAGALGLLDESSEQMLVINGDILTAVDFRSLLSFHREHKASLTVGVRKYDLEVPYGVVRTNNGLVEKVDEKPVYTFFVNAGIYLLEPLARRLIPRGKPMDMTDLIDRLLDEGHTVASYPIVEYWLDIGRQADYEKAQEDLRNGRVS